MIELTLSSESQSIFISVFGYKNEFANLVCDRNWLNCNVELVNNTKQNNINATFTTDEFRLFYDELKLLILNDQAYANFVSMERWMEFRITKTLNRKFNINGYVNSGDLITDIFFEFVITKPMLSKFYKNMELVINRYPEILNK